jgi:hypothetical protein
MSKQHTVIMTFPSWKWNEYGKYCLPTADKNWPDNFKVIAIVEKPGDIPYKVSGRVQVIDFDDAVGERQHAFEQRNAHRNIMDMGTTGNIAVQAAKFSRKALAQLYILENTSQGYVWYIDADTKILQKLTPAFLNNLTSSDAYIGCTPRWWRRDISNEQALQTKQLGLGYTETGVMFWNTEHHMHKEWCKLYAAMYDEDKIFEYNIWHDCIAFDHATLTLLTQQKIGLADLGFGVRSSHPLVAGPMGKYFDHMKGDRKFVGFSKERIKMHGED